MYWHNVGKDITPRNFNRHLSFFAPRAKQNIGHKVKAILIFTVLFTMAGLLYAEESIMVVTENWKPYNYQESGVVKGSSTQIVREVLDRAGVTYDIRIYPWARTYFMAQKEKNVMIYTIIRTPLREDLFKWIRPLGKADTVSFYKLKGRKDIVIDSLEDVKKYKVGLVREDVKHQYLISQGFENGRHIEPVETQEQNINKLRLKRIDLIVFSQRNYSSEMSSFKALENKVEEVFILFEAIPYMAFSISTSDEMVERIVKSYDQLVVEGRIKRF